jgi:hypothetical protein
VAWLKQEWKNVLAPRGAGVPLNGFTWYALTDTIGRERGLRTHDDQVHEGRAVCRVGPAMPSRQVRTTAHCSSG